MTPQPTVSVVDSIREVDPAEWDGLAGAVSVYSSHAWLTFAEAYGDCRPRYLLMHTGDRLTAALPTFEFDADVPRYYDPAFLFAPALSGPRAGRPLLLGGTRQGYATEALLAADLPAARRTDLLSALVAQLRTRGSDGGLAALLYVTDEFLDLLLPVLAEDDLVVMLDARALLAVDPDGLIGYRRRVTGNTSARMRKEMRRFQHAGCAVEVRRLSECHEQLGALAAQVAQRYGRSTSAEEEGARFAAQADSVDDLTRVILARRGPQVVGFTQFLTWRSTMHGRVHGLDDSMARSAALYYNLTYYHAIEYAAEHHFSQIDLGCDSYEAKVRRGARLEPLWGVVLNAHWPADAVGAIRHAEQQRWSELSRWDAGVRTATAERVNSPIRTEGRSVCL